MTCVAARATAPDIGREALAGYCRKGIWYRLVPAANDGLQIERHGSRGWTLVSKSEGSGTHRRWEDVAFVHRRVREGLLKKHWEGLGA